MLLRVLSCAVLLATSVLRALRPATTTAVAAATAQTRWESTGSFSSLLLGAGLAKQCYISIARASEMISAVEMLLVSVESLSYPAACSWARLMPQALSPDP